MTNDTANFFSTWQSGSQSAGQAFKNFVSSTLQDIAKLIEKMLILAAVQEIIGLVVGGGGVGGGGGDGGILSSVINYAGSGGITGGVSSVGGYHSGGMIGMDSPTFTRDVPSWMFAGAPRFHNGGGYLNADEYPAILLSGERVLNRHETSVYNSYFGLPGAPGSLGQDGVRRFHDGGMAGDGYTSLNGGAALSPRARTTNNPGGSGATINMPITIHSSGDQGGTGGKDPLSDPAFAKTLHKKLQGVVHEEIMKATRYRGILNQG